MFSKILIGFTIKHHYVTESILKNICSRNNNFNELIGKHALSVFPIFNVFVNNFFFCKIKAVLPTL